MAQLPVPALVYDGNDEHVGHVWKAKPLYAADDISPSRLTVMVGEPVVHAVAESVQMI